MNDPIASSSSGEPRLDRAELVRRLKDLASRPPPTDLFTGAMCYDVAPPPQFLEYVCPVCNARTLYAVSDHPAGKKARDQARIVELGANVLWTLSQQLDACRRLARQITEITVRLDETALCRKCRPDARDFPLALIVQLKGEEKPHRVEGVTPEDLQMLIEFLAGQDCHAGERGHQTALKDHLPRLEELLGIKAK
jgi:hypothetical protein